MNENHVKTREMCDALRITDRTWREWMRFPEKITLGNLHLIVTILGITEMDLWKEV